MMNRIFRQLRRYALASVLVGACGCFPSQAGAGEPEPIRFNTNFEGGSLGRVEFVDADHYRCHVQGQQDEHGRNRQASWYYFRIDGVRGRALHLTLTDFVGEYNGKPGACPMGPQIIPVYSQDGEHWQDVPDVSWDDQAKEAAITLRPDGDSVWVAHQAPYTPHRLTRLLEQVKQCDDARIEVIGKTAQGRDLVLVTVTNAQPTDHKKATVWLQARQHAWESGTSFVMEGALRFVTSDDPVARSLRSRVVFKFMPMVDPDGAARGRVRFNTNGYDVNRHWSEVDLHSPRFLDAMPEIWYVKKAIFACVDSGSPIDILINMHNTETAEYLQTMASKEGAGTAILETSERLVQEARFRPSRGPIFDAPIDSTTNSLFAEKGVPVALMEQRIARDPETGRTPSPEDRMAFGEKLIRIMAESALHAHGEKEGEQ